MRTSTGSAASAVVDIGSLHAGLADLPARPAVDDKSRTSVSSAAGLRRPMARAASSPEAFDEPLIDEALPRQRFLRELRREKRRAERSGSPLSLVVYQMEGSESNAASQTDRLLCTLLGSKRETDTVGLLGERVIGVLCPDTDEAGANAFVAKVTAQQDAAGFTAVTSTYPDEAFERLADDQAEATSAFAPIVVSDQTTRQGTSARLKRALDVVLALIAICAFGPLMLVIAIAIALTSRGPIVFRQKRLGQGGVPFTFYKFRSMVPNGDDRIHRAFVSDLIKAGNNAQGGQGQAAPYKLQVDPRVTPIGRFIRRTSIDELPQLFNVLKGDMSMVGPRPPIPYEAVQYQPWHLRRIVSVKPGITGLWQVEGRSRVSFDEMVRMDLRYIRDHSLVLDLRILVKTVLVVLRCEGAR